MAQLGTSWRIPGNTHADDVEGESERCISTCLLGSERLWARLWRWFQAKLCRPCSAPEPQVSLTTEANVFQRLPPELWLDISDLLPLLSAASLACTCRWMYEVFGRKTYSKLGLPENSSTKLEFLSYLDPSLPTFRLCYPCAKFHRRDNLKDEQRIITGDYRWWTNQHYKCDRRMGFAYVAEGFVLSWSAIQLIMRAHNVSSEYGIPLDTLMRKWESGGPWKYTAEQKSKLKWERCGSWKHTAEPLIVDGRLLIKVQSITTINASTQQDFSIMEGTPGNGCHESPNHWPALLNCALGHVRTCLSDMKQCDICKPLRRCPECPTEYMIETRKIGGGIGDTSQERDAKYNFVLTKWRDFGEGKSPQSLDWQSLNICLDEEWGGPLRSLTFEGVAKIRTRFERGVRNCFEDLPVLGSVRDSLARSSRESRG